MMSKKEILEMLKDMKNQAVDNSCKQIDEDIKVEQLRISQELDIPKVAQDIESKVREILDMMEDFKVKAEKIGCERKDGYYGSIAYSIHSFSRNMEKTIIDNEILVNSDHLKALRNNRQTLRSIVIKEWDKVISNCVGLSKNKDVVKYLVSLGFDEKMFNPEGVNTSLMIPVNTDLLCRKETKNEVD